MRIIPAAENPEPLLFATVETCVVGSTTFHVENRATVEGLYTFHSWVDVELSTDSKFTQVYQSFTLNYDDVMIPLLAYDGSEDFAGPSGTVVTILGDMFVETLLPITDESFFRKPFPIWIRATSHAFLSGTAPNTMQNDQTLGVGSGFLFNQLGEW